MSYETLDFIADTYIPILVFLALSSIFMPFFKKYNDVHGLTQKIPIIGTFKEKLAFVGFAFFELLCLIIVVYAVMFIDAFLLIWPYFSLDYSTHTALSLALVCFVYDKTRRFNYLVIASFFLYVILMLYQQYHSIEDVLSTAVCFLILAYALRKYGLNRNVFKRFS